MTSSVVVWLQSDGTPVSCVEKLKLLNENLAEFTSFYQDILDDAVAVGCLEQQVKQIFSDLVTKANSTV